MGATVETFIRVYDIHFPTIAATIHYATISEYQEYKEVCAQCFQQILDLITERKKRTGRGHIVLQVPKLYLWAGGASLITECKTSVV